MTTLSLSEIIRTGWGLTIKNWGFVILLLLVAFVLMALPQILPSILGVIIPNNDGLVLVLSLVMTLVSIWLQSVIILGQTKAILNIVDGKPATLSTLFECKSLWLRYWVASLVLVLMGAGILVVATIPVGLVVATLGQQNGASPAAIVSMIIALVALVAFIGFIIRFQFYPYLIVDQNLGSVASLKASWNMTRGQVGRILLLGLFLLMIYVLGLVPLLLGLLLTVPFSYMVLAVAYRRLSAI